MYIIIKSLEILLENNQAIEMKSFITKELDTLKDSLTSITIDEVLNTTCAICGNPCSKKTNKNLYFKLSEFEDEIRKIKDSHKDLWRDTAYKFTERYLNEGIPDRCVSRVQQYGIDIPVKGYEDKKLYGWFENVWGYVTASKKVADERGLDWNDYWKEGRDNKIYLVHAKDNIPFHTVIFPILLLGTKDGYRMPDKIISDEFKPRSDKYDDVKQAIEIDKSLIKQEKTKYSKEDIDKLRKSIN
jgi:methionyl-tRNA synthetase